MHAVVRNVIIWSNLSFCCHPTTTDLNTTTAVVPEKKKFRHNLLQGRREKREKPIKIKWKGKQKKTWICEVQSVCRSQVLSSCLFRSPKSCRNRAVEFFFCFALLCYWPTDWPAFLPPPPKCPTLDSSQLQLPFPNCNIIKTGAERGWTFAPISNLQLAENRISVG